MRASSPTPDFVRFVQTYRKIAVRAGLNWDLPVDAAGKVRNSERWDFNVLTGTPKPPGHFLDDFGMDAPTLEVLNATRLRAGASALSHGALSKGWQELLKVLVVRSLFETRNGASHTLLGICRPVRALATCCYEREPWQITAEVVARALQITAKVGKSEKLRSLIEAQVVTFDNNNLAVGCPLHGKQTRQKRTGRNVGEIRRSLDERRRSDRLPGAKEFWEMLRIVLEEKPTSTYDAVRFAAVEIAVLMGLRGEEVATVPADPIFLKPHFDIRGRSPSENGGVNHTMFLRHFSEKQRLRSSVGIIYAETSTSVLNLFENEMSDLVARVTEITAPLRQRLEAQIRTGRILPEFPADAWKSLAEIYPYLTGNPFVYESAENQPLAQRYRQSFDPAILQEILTHQVALSRKDASVTQSLRTYFARPESAWIPKIDLDTGKPVVADGRKRRLRTIGVRVGELEDAIRQNIPTKLSDTEGFPLEGGRRLNVNECLFLVPKRALIEGRNGGVCDLTRYAFVGRLAAGDISMALGCPGQEKQSFFAKYGKPDAQQYTLNSHSMRHMHNNELFAAGVADTIITNRFGRKSVAQSHAYDSRTLAQELAEMDLPEGSADLLVGPARDAFKLIRSGRGKGPIADEFQRIQRKEGDEAAIVYLAAEADGMQITPYGLCMNSFVIESCPKHLECFNGCCHLLRTDSAIESQQLETLASRYRVLLSALDIHPGSEAAKANARKQATERLAAMEQALATKPGERVFPDGKDLNRPFGGSLFESLR